MTFARVQRAIEDMSALVDRGDFVQVHRLL